GDAVCTSRTPGSVTVGWCTGGSPAPPSDDAISAISPAGIIADANYLYIFDAGSSRLVRIPID
ncbi:MAG: hypothetical protein AB7H97_08725, partial [Pseudobdellovibrionaceae bacterium]